MGASERPGADPADRSGGIGVFGCRDPQAHRYALVESERDPMRVTAERMREYYATDAGNGKEAAFSEVDPWSPDETG